MLKLNVIGWITLALVIIGSINWALVGIFDFNFVETIFGEMSPISRLIYIIVGISSIYLLVTAIPAVRLRWRETHRPHPA